MRKMATLVQELTDDGAYDLDADPAVEGASEATWLDADSVSPALARDKKLAVRVQALERAIASHGDDSNLSVAAAVRPASQLAFSAARHQAANMLAHHRVLSHCGCDSLARLAFEIKGVQTANSYLTKSFSRQTTRNC